ncbi:uncharacterized protein LOC128862945 [Anastrepha ludens]|uniref:uncharacterized protein LOC128862945 n=1 Tax=Anastrepha ludens TaxID=28586 RepID=UPI0023B113AA|nr:uncharacterized protein LOC128862945 [Anastrepha ludens]
MVAHKRVFISLTGLLAIQLVAAHPRLTYSALYASEEEGLVRNVDYAAHLPSSEAAPSSEESGMSKESNNEACLRIGPNIPTKTRDDAYSVFAKVLIRDSREVFKNKLRELKLIKTEKEMDVTHFFVVLKRINKVRLVNASHEGELMFDAIRRIDAKNADSFDDEPWLNRMSFRIFCLVLEAKADADIDSLADNFTIEEEISQHLEVFKEFWLDYAPPTNTKNSASDLAAETDSESSDTVCVIDVANLPANATNITHIIFAEIIIRDTQKVAQRKLDELESLQEEQYKWYIKDLRTMLEHIGNRTHDYAKQEGRSMYDSLQKINEVSGEGDTAWLEKLVGRILCKAQKVSTEDEMKRIAEHFSYEEDIEEHFEVFKQFWLKCKNLFIHKGVTLYKHCRREKKTNYD